MAGKAQLRNWASDRLATGRILGDLGAHVAYVMAVIFFAIGLHLLGAIAFPFMAMGKKAPAGRGMLAAFLLGIVFCVALGPCTFAFMAPILGVTLSLGATNTPYAVLLLGMSGVGHATVIVAAGTFTNMVQRCFDQARRECPWQRQ